MLAKTIAGTLVGFVLWSASATMVRGQSALDLLSGFDAERLDGVFPIDNRDQAGEMARLLYRLRKADAASLAERRKSERGDLKPGELIRLDGAIERLRQYPVPDELAEFLQLDAFYEITITMESAARGDSPAEAEPAKPTAVIFTPPLPAGAGDGDQVRGDAIYLESVEGTDYFAAGSLAWMPAQSDRPGWQLLARQGVDLTEVARLGERNRRTLEADDGEVFYSVLAASKMIAATDATSLPSPQPLDPVALLSDPTDYHGEWIRIQAVTVRVTKVAVDQPELRDRLGQDHYFQVDASGDLGNTVVQLQRGEGEAGDPILMSGSYPISLVTTELPPFLSQRMGGGENVVAMVSFPIAIDGFFLRLWSYESEFMRREGGGKQVGPLIVASKWYSRQPSAAAEEGIEWIGYALAVAIVLAILGTIVWTRRNAKADAEARRRGGGPERIEVPPM
jgi:hypothetical protein